MTPLEKAVRRHGQRELQNQRWSGSPRHIVTRTYGGERLQGWDEREKRRETGKPYFQHQPTGLYVQHHASVIDPQTQLTGETHYVVPGLGIGGILPGHQLRPAPASMDVRTAVQHNRTLARRSPNLFPRLWTNAGRPVAEALGHLGGRKAGPLLSRTANQHGPTSASPNVHKRLQAVLSNPTHDTWDAASGVIISPHGGLGGTTLWQAVTTVDPTFPRRAPITHLDPAGKEVFERKWERIPDQMLLARALRHAAGLKPRAGKLTEGELDSVLWAGRGKDGAWISPRGDLHVLQRGQNHIDWLKQHAQQLGVRMPAKIVHTTMGDTTSPEHELLHAGWIKKSDANTYEAHKLDKGLVHRIRRHMREHHPDESHFALQVGRGKAKRGYALPVWEGETPTGDVLDEIVAGASIAGIADQLLN